MKEYNYLLENNNYYQKTKINAKINEKHISIMDNLRKLNNNINVKKLLNMKQKNNKKLNNQVIIHTEIKNFMPLKEYIINLNGIENNHKNNYKKKLSPDVLSIPLHKNYKEGRNYKSLQKELNHYNSVSKINNINDNKNKDDLGKISNKIIKPIKPYKKKSVLFHPNKTKEKFLNAKLDLTNLSETIHSNNITDRTFDKTKISSINDGNDSSFLFINDNKSNKFIKNINKRETLCNKQINNFFCVDKNYHSINNQIINANKKKCQRIFLSNKYIQNKNYKQIKSNSKKNLLKNDIIIDKYQKRFTQILILLLEKYFKTYFLKNKYIFLNNLKKYIRRKNKSIDNKEKSIRSFYNCNYLTDRNNENIKDCLYRTKYKTRNDNRLLYKLKNGNETTSPGKYKFSELFRNKSELFKKEEKISRRKSSKSKDKHRETTRNVIFEKIPNNNIIKNDKSIDNIIRFKKNHYFYNKYKPMLIVKKIKTKDNRIHIDIKYLEQINNNLKRKFKNLNISNTDSINIIRKGNNYFQFDKIYYKIENQEDYMFKKEKKLSCIQEEE